MLTVRDVHYSYKTNKPLFTGIDFELGEGKICGLLGKNGAGKSTLLRLITGALFPKSGEVRFDNYLTSARRVQTLEDIYFLQEEDELPKISLKDYVNFYSVFYPNFSHDIFRSVLERFEVDFTEKIKNLSFGQKKKFHVAFALATQVRLLILDEPTNGLDIPSKAVFRSVVSEHLGDHQSIIISTHQIRDLGQLLDHIVMVEKGKIILNEDLYSLTERFDCKFTPGKSLPDSAFYSEPVAGGHV